LLSDGVLLPSEIAVRFAAAGYKAVAITDHADYSNIDFLLRAVLKFTRKWPGLFNLKIFPGVELTHLAPEQFKPLVKYARAKGAKIVIGHGETPVEPVVQGTNRAALEADVDILAHPGRISDEDAALAARRGTFLEVTSRKGHCETNRHVVSQAKKFGAKIILSLDSHSPEDIIAPQELENVGREAGLSQEDIIKVYRDVLEAIV
jgi:histidinol phosphatase-like PHP family hydrolase